MFERVVSIKNLYCICKSFRLEFRKGLEKKSSSFKERRESLDGEKGCRRVSEHGLGAAGPILGSDVMHTL